MISAKFHHSQKAFYSLEQGWATYGPRAGSGPRRHFDRPASTHSEITTFRPENDLQNKDLANSLGHAQLAWPSG